ncbi:MBL fold metallo-hydrolase [Nocardioides carbamazepini]|uniref:MBL fold metallo-hydrolase n=1 Tax=Nocardioides carbamazepini TaxID=2854259 RepID=UPI002149E412|nr:MBL fold metallo-hydrolase [Nocardioides carbamazepini]MCR1784511.1 MBL fold metallo-hydrolase [Nocardioides carbamazepini]
MRVDHAVTSGTFSLDGETFEVDNNVWVVGDDTECVVIDAPHSVEDILAVVAGRRVKAIICTHAHDDHVRVAPALREALNDGAGAPILLHPHDKPLWELTHGGDPSGQGGYLWDVDLSDGQVIEVAGTSLRVIHTPGHAPGAVCLYAPDLGCVFTGDTLFHGGPGATGRSYSDRPTLEASIRARLFDLPADTVVHTGHGDDTTIATERANLAAATIRQRIAARLPGEEMVP